MGICWVYFLLAVTSQEIPKADVNHLSPTIFSEIIIIQSGLLRHFSSSRDTGDSTGSEIEQTVDYSLCLLENC